MVSVSLHVSFIFDFTGTIKKIAMSIFEVLCTPNDLAKRNTFKLCFGNSFYVKKEISRTGLCKICAKQLLEVHCWPVLIWRIRITCIIPLLYSMHGNMF